VFAAYFELKFWTKLPLDFGVKADLLGGAAGGAGDWNGGWNDLRC
jgi:hypothetical protein